MTQRSIFAALVALALLSPAAVLAQASTCPPNAPTPFTAGPVSPTNGFAEYVIDSNGLSLELCLDGDGATGLCFFDPVVPGNLFSQQIGFGPEAFWWLSETTLDTAAEDPVTGDTFSALVVMAAEAAFATENPAEGQQFPFTRLRINLDVPAPGIYTVTHPYGVETYTIEALEAGDDLRETHDLQFTPGVSGNQGRVGPWLRHVAPAPPAGYIGNGDTGTVTGSPCGTNFFRVSAVGLDGETPIVIDPGDSDEDGSTSSVGTTLFVVYGKLWDGRLGTPLVADRTTYDRAASGAGQVDVFATSTADAAVTVEGGPNLPAGPLPLGTAEDTKFFRSEVLAPDASVLPSFLELLATDGPTDSTRLLRPLVDVVRITRAEYNAATGTLLVEATSSDELVPPALTVLEFGAPVGQGILTVAPPARVTVVSSHGGRDSEPVSVVSAAAPGNRPPVANADTAATDEDTPVTVAVLANDTDPDGDALTVLSVSGATNGTAVNLGTAVRFTPAANFFGTGGFSYVASDGRGGVSAPATVTVTVNPVNDPPVAAADAATTPEDTAVTVLVLANDTDIDGDTLTVTAVGGFANGTAVVDEGGASVTFTPAANFAGQAGFTYTVSDGTATAVGAVTVTVTPVNDAPVATDDVGATVVGGSVTIAVLANDTDVDGDALTVTELTQPAFGSVVLNANQTVTYTAPSNAPGEGVFTYRAMDPSGAVSNVATVRVTVTDVTVDLDIRRLTTTNRVRTSRNQTVSIVLRVQNGGTVDQPRFATVTGVQNGATVYEQSLAVRDAPGGGDTSFTFPSYTPTATGTISWSAHIFDDDPDADNATATTQVVP